MRNYLRATALGLSLLSCAGNSRAITPKPLEVPTAADRAKKDRLEKCKKIRATLKAILYDPERPWTGDFSWLSDYELAYCSDIESEVVASLRAILAKQAAVQVNECIVQVAPPVPALPPPSPPLDPLPPRPVAAEKPEIFKPVDPSVTLSQVSCAEQLAQIKMVCGVPVLGEIAKGCGIKGQIQSTLEGKVLTEQTLRTIIRPNIVDREWLEVFCSSSHGGDAYRSILIYKKRSYGDHDNTVEKWFVMEGYSDAGLPGSADHEYDYQFFLDRCASEAQKRDEKSCSPRQIRKIMEGLCPDPAK